MCFRHDAGIDAADTLEVFFKIAEVRTIMRKEWYQLTGEETLKELHVTKAGLSSEETAAALEKYGRNALKEAKQKSTLQVFLSQFADLLVVILIVAAVISMISGNFESAAVIFVVLILNAVMGTVENKKAEKSLKSLKSLSSPSAKVLRDGTKTEIHSEDIVPGDILLLEAGDLIAADARILDSFSLQVNESSLTGESTNVDKVSEAITESAPLADRADMVYSGSLVTYGRAVAVVTSTGMDTEIGHIAGLMNTAKEQKTPLQVSLDQFSGRLAAIIMIICCVIFFLCIYRGMAILDALLFAVALAVAAIPEALGSIVTIVQAMGTQKMAGEHAIVKELRAVESLGCVSVICSDKTGTLTQNKMTVQDVYIDGHVIAPNDLSLDDPLHRYLLYNAVLTNDSAIVDGKGIGDPTEYSLLEMADQISVSHEKIRGSMERLEELPFDSDRKLMTTKYMYHGVPTIFTKGALDVLLPRTTHVHTSDGVIPMTAEQRKAIAGANMDFSKNGLRVLAFCYKTCEADTTLTTDEECDYTFLGLISMMDPPRPESRQAVSDARRAGIKPVMITGDHKVTATAIARKIGIFEEGDLALTGAELDAMPEEKLDDDVDKISVYARVSPENKIRIVNAWQKRGNIVAMTGDGVNDAPALKKADIGVAMGITGTEVSKDAAAMILTDDNFATIIKAVANGRNVYRNIRNAILFLLSGNMAGIFAVVFAAVMALPVPFAAVQLLFINLLTDSLPALAIGMEPAEWDLLNAKPRSRGENIMSKRFTFDMMWMGALIAVCTMGSYYIGLNRIGADAARTMAFATLTAARLFHGFNLRSSHSIFRIGFKRNWYSLGAFALGMVFLGLVLFVPVLQPLFAVCVIGRGEYWMILLFAAVPTILIQAGKVIRDGRSQKER